MMLRRERKETKRQRIALKRYVAFRMEEDIEESVRRVSGKARRIRRANERAKKKAPRDFSREAKVQRSTP